MTYISARPIVADDPLAYFSSLTAPKMRSERPAQPVAADRALEVMFGYYAAE